MSKQIDGKIAIFISGPIRYVSLVSKRLDVVFNGQDYDCFYHLWKDDLGNKVRDCEVADYRELEDNPRTKVFVLQEPYSEHDFADSIGTETGSRSSINATMGMFFSVNLLCHYLKQLPDFHKYKYILRLRTDCAITNDNFMDLLDTSGKTLNFPKNYHITNSEICDHICFGDVESFFRLWHFDGMSAIYNAYTKGKRNPERTLRNRFKTEMADVRFIETISRYEDYHIIYSPPQKQDPATINNVLNQNGISAFFEEAYKLVDLDEVKRFVEHYNLKENNRVVLENIDTWKQDWSANKMTNVHSSANYDKSIKERRDICFFGGMRVENNRDAVKWFVVDIFPLILEKHPDVKFHLFGSGNEKFKALLEKHPNIKVPGYVENAEEAISNCRVFVCPLTYGAGMKGKLGSAAVAGTAIVSTTVGVEGFDFVDGQNCFIADEPSQFADKCVQLLNDDQIWKKFSVNAQKMVYDNFSPEAVGVNVDEVLGKLSTEPRSVVEKVEKPKATIITSCYNAEKFLDECVRSILNQTMRDWELFLIDDASNDNTRAMIERYCELDGRIKAFYFDDNKGPYVRRNYAIKKANSDYIVIHDADDIMAANKLEVLYKEISINNDICVVGSFYRSFLDEFKGQDLTDMHVLPTDQQQMIEYFSKFRHAMSHGTAIIRKKIFELIGLYDGNPFSADAFLFAKIAVYLKYIPNSKIVNIPQSLSFIRKHTSSQTHQVCIFDPSGKRLLYQQYCMQKLAQAEKNIANGADVCEQLQQCDCSDFLMRFDSQISQTQMVRVPRDMLVGRLGWAMNLFGEKMYVNLISTLDGIEAAVLDIGKRFLNFSLLKGYAYYALQFSDKAREQMELEIQYHDNPAAKAFLTDIIDAGVQIDPLDWCRQNARTFNIQLLEVKAENQVQQPTTHPLVSVIMPAYNAANHIEEAIESVLIQNYQNFELMIINDGSTDNTEQIVKKFDDQRIRYFSQENAGASSARNLAIEKSTSQYIIPLDSDDRITPDFISQHLKVFQQYPEADLIYCDDRLIDENGQTIRIIERPEYTDRKHLIRDLFRCGFPVVPFRTCIKRDVFNKIGFFDEKLKIAEDYDMMRRFVKHGLVARHLKGDYYLRRIETNSLSRNHTVAKAKFHFDVVKSFTESFDYEQLFPDVQWENIAVENRQMHARFLFALTFMTIGQDYVKTNSPVMAKAGFDYAQEQLDRCLEISPDNTKALQLMQKCKQIRSQFAEALI